eukprot:gene10808-22554_t
MLLLTRYFVIKKQRGFITRYIVDHNVVHTSQSREGFGSFHSADVEDLIRIPASMYIVPENGRDINTQNLAYTETLRKSCKTFGTHCKSELFLIENEWTFINHGAFGGAFKALINESHAWRMLSEAQPLRFYDRILLPQIVYSLRQMANFLNCPPEELLPIQNVTTGLNSAINSSSINPGDEIIYTSLTYGSTKKILQEFALRRGAVLRIVDIPLPLLSEVDVIRYIETNITKKSKLIILDQITSNTAITMPVLHIARMCREISPEITIIIDAAHSLLSQDVQIYSSLHSNSTNNIPLPSSQSTLPSHTPITSPPLATDQDVLSIADAADFWITNGHKWFCSPKGCAFMWVNPRYAKPLRPCVISHGYIDQSNDDNDGHGSGSGSGDSDNSNSDWKKKRQGSRRNHKLLSAFSWDGCRDYSAMLTVPSALRIWEALPGGPSAARQYMTALIEDAAELLISTWSLSADDFPCSSTRGCSRCVDAYGMYRHPRIFTTGAFASPV